MSNVAIRNLITGINEASCDLGRHPGWPSDKIAAAVIEKIAEEWSGPEVVEGSLPKEAALEIEMRLIDAADELKKLGHAPKERTKTASADDLMARAASAANFWIDRMIKQAGPGSLTDAGPNNLADAARTDAMAALDLSQRPAGYAEQPQGADTTLPAAGVTGPREITDPARPGVSPSISNSLTDQSMKAAAARLRDGLVARKVPEKVAAAIASGFMTPLYASLNEQHVKAAMASFHEADQEMLGKIAALGKGPEDGVVGLLADRLLKLAKDEELAKKAPRVSAVARDYAKTAAANFEAAKQDRIAEKLASVALGYKEAGEEDTEPGDGDGSNGLPAPEPPASEGPPAGGAPDEQTMLLQMIWEKLKQLAPESADAQIAAAGLMDHPKGQEVLAHVVQTAKTAAEADTLLRKVLADNPGLRKVATVDTHAVVKREFAKTAAARAGSGTPTASTLGALLKQSGAGSLTSHGPNTVADAAKTDEMAALEKQQRPAGYAEASQGKAPVNAPSTPETVVEAPRDGVPHVSGDNVVAREDKKAADAAYVEEFKKVAGVYGPALPVAWTEQQKIAAVQNLMAIPPSNRDAKLRELLSAR